MWKTDGDVPKPSARIPNNVQNEQIATKTNSEESKQTDHQQNPTSDAKCVRQMETDVLTKPILAKATHTPQVSLKRKATQQPISMEETKEETHKRKSAKMQGPQPRKSTRAKRDFQDWYGTIDPTNKYVFNAQTLFEPVGYNQAMRSAHSIQWQGDMEEEMKAHDENDTWTLVELPERRTRHWL